MHPDHLFRAQRRAQHGRRRARGFAFPRMVWPCHARRRHARRTKLQGLQEDARRRWVASKPSRIVRRRGPPREPAPKCPLLSGVCALHWWNSIWNLHWWNGIWVLHRWDGVCALHWHYRSGVLGPPSVEQTRELGMGGGREQDARIRVHGTSTPAG
jgi:hypothetical protein